MTHPQKKYYRQRAHANPLSDHSYDYPLSPELMDWLPFFTEGNIGRDVEMVDVGCGYGGLLVGLGTLYPDSLSVGFELRVKVSDWFPVANMLALNEFVDFGDWWNFLV